MKPSSDLHTLIKSMSKTEKGYFKKYATRFVKGSANTYFILFDLIDQQETYDEEKVLENIQDKKIKKSYSYYKNYLYNIILKILKESNRNKSLKARLFDKIEAAELLFKRGLKSQAHKIIKKVKKSATENHFTLILLYAHQLEEQIIKDEADLVKIRNHTLPGKEIEHVKTYLNVARYRYWANLTLSYILTEASELPEEDKNILANIRNHLRYNEVVETGHTGMLRYYYQTRAIINVVYRNYMQIIPDFKNLIRSFEKNENYLTENLEDYIYYNMVYAFILTKMKHKKAFEYRLEKLHNIIESRYELLQDYRYNKYKMRLYNLELLFYIHNADLPILNGRVNTYLQAFNTFGKDTDGLNYVWFTHYISYYYMINQHYGEAIAWLHKKAERENSENRSESVIITRLFFIIIYFETGDYDLIESQLRSIDRFINKQNISFELEHTVICYLKKILRKEDETEKLNLFKKLKKELKSKPFKTYIDSNILDHFNFNAWIDAKIAQKPFKTYMQKDNLFLNMINTFVQAE